MGERVAVSAATVANPTQITFTAPAVAYSDGDTIFLDVAGTTPRIFGWYTLTLVTSTTGTVPVNVTAASGVSGFSTFPNFFYVKDDGTGESGTATANGGRYKARKTGDWTTAFSAVTEYYASWAACIDATDTPTDYDVVRFSNLHAKTISMAGTKTVNSAGAWNGGGVLFESVDDTNCENYSEGAVETWTGTTDTLDFNNNIKIAGIKITCGNHVNNIPFNLDGCWNFEWMDGKVTTANQLNYALFDVKGNSVLARFKNFDLDFGANHGYIFRHYGGGRVEMLGGVLTGTGTVDIESNTFGFSGGAYLFAKGYDFGMITELIDESFTTSNDHCFMRLEECTLSTAIAWRDTTISNPHHRIELINCDDTSGNKFHRIWIEDGTGKIINDDSNYISADTAHNATADKFSYKVVTTEYCSHLKPFVFNVMGIYSELSTAGENEIIIELRSNAPIYKNDIAFFLNTKNSTTEVTPQWYTTGKTVGAGNYGIDPSADSPAQLDTSSLSASDWVGETGGEYYYKATLTTTTSADGFCDIRGEFYRPNISANDELFFSGELRRA